MHGTEDTRGLFERLTAFMLSDQARKRAWSHNIPTVASVYKQHARKGPMAAKNVRSAFAGYKKHSPRKWLLRLFNNVPEKN